MSLNLTVKKPGNLLGTLLRADITELQYAQIVLLLSNPDRFVIAEKPRMGFRPPTQEARSA